MLRTILVVDDDPLVVAGFASAFRGAGKTVFSAATAETAIEVVQRDRVDFALIDLFLGGDWGLDLIRALRDASPATELALMSGYVSAKSAVAAIQLGARHVFFKPITPRAVLDQVERGVHVFDQQKRHGYPTLARIEWEHIMRVLVDSRGNISEAARRIGIRRQSLQRKLKKAAPLD